MTEWLTLSGVRPVLLALVALLALVVTRYAVTNFRLDPRRRSFVSKLVGCLVAVLVLIVSNHIVVFFVAWMSISLQLHSCSCFILSVTERYWRLIKSSFWHAAQKLF